MIIRVDDIIKCVPRQRSEGAAVAKRVVGLPNRVRIALESRRDVAARDASRSSSFVTRQPRALSIFLIFKKRSHERTHLLIQTERVRVSRDARARFAFGSRTFYFLFFHERKLRTIELRSSAPPQRAALSAARATPAVVARRCSAGSAPRGGTSPCLGSPARTPRTRRCGASTSRTGLAWERRSRRPTPRTGLGRPGRGSRAWRSRR